MLNIDPKIILIRQNIIKISMVKNKDGDGRRNYYLKESGFHKGRTIDTIRK